MLDQADYLPIGVGAIAEPFFHDVQRIPVVGPGRLQLAPIEEDALPIGPQIGGLLRRPESLDNAETGLFRSVRALAGEQ